MTCTEYSIVVSLPNFRFAGVYYPPYSLSNTHLEADLTQIGSVDLLIGDINTRFSCNPSTTKKLPRTLHLPRSLLFQSWAATNNMIHLSDNQSHNTADNIPDHAFSKINLQSALSLNFLPTHTLSFPTDHRYLLQLHLNIPSPNPSIQFPCQAKSTTPLRFRVQRLREPDISSKYCNAWSIIDQLSKSYNAAEEYDIDMLDALLCSSIQAISDAELGTYEPTQARKKQDKTSDSLRNYFDIPASIQLLKRAQPATAAQMPLTSSSCSHTPLEECINHYMQIFNSNPSTDTPDTTINLNCSTQSSSTRFSPPRPESSQQNHNRPEMRITEEHILSSGLADMISP